MSREPTYGDPDNPWDDEDRAEQMEAIDLSGLSNVDLLQRCWDITAPNRKRFKKAAEKNRWKRIESKIAKGIIDTRWVDSCIDTWATDMNKKRLVINFSKLMTAILNSAAMTDWLMDNQREGDIRVIKPKKNERGYFG